MSGDVHVQFCEQRWGKFLALTHLVTTGGTKDLLESRVKPRIEEFLAERGLKLSAAKTKITHIDEGFDFLGQNVRKYKGKLLIKPSKASIKKFIKKVLGIIKGNKTSRTDVLIGILNPIIRGWGNYHRHVVSKECFAKIDHIIWQATWRWAKRRHPNKGVGWIKERYYDNKRNRWEFFGENEKKDRIVLFTLSSIPIIRHIKIPSGVNPYDPKDRRKIEAREERFWRSGTMGTDKTRDLWLRQQGKCLNCGTMLTDETGWHIHHSTPKAMGGSDELSNLQLLHPNCHRQVHVNPLLSSGIS
jgi:RNA-directed DNA polymerase